jgi:hypothetical protein
LSLINDTVTWSNASEGDGGVGKEEIHAYWSRQWKEFDPHLEPIEMIDRAAGRTDVRVH